MNSETDFCQWCYDKGFRYIRGPWLHGVGCPNAPKTDETDDMRENLKVLDRIKSERDSLRQQLAKAKAERDEAKSKTKETAKDFETAFRLVRKENDDLRARATRWQTVAEEQHEALVLCNMVPPTISKVLIERALASFTLAAEEGK